MLTLGSAFGLLGLGNWLVAHWVTYRRVRILVAIFSGQGPTNFLVDFREAQLSSTDFREALLVLTLNKREINFRYLLMCTVWLHKMDSEYIANTE